MNKILTISIAGYNMEKYIRQALDSLTDERIVNYLEVFIIDDGGKDGTLDIAREYANRFPGTFFPIHKENGGYGSTFNYSIEHASGMYFRCLDGDDWYDKEGLYKLVSELQNASEDVIITPYFEVYMDENCDEWIRKGVFSWPGATRSRQIVDVFRPEMRFSLPMITFRTEILRESKVHLPEHMLYTDVLDTVFPFSDARTIGYLNEFVYCYRLGRKGQSVGRDARIKHTEDVLALCEMLFRFYNEQKALSCETIAYITNRAASYYYRAAIHYLLLPPPSRQSLKRIKQFEEKMYQISPDLFLKKDQMGKICWFMRICRKTNYLPYWSLKLVFPRGIPSKT